jgi:hypothetical protein
MSEAKFRLVPIVTALVLSVGVAACAGDSQADADATGESSMAAETGERAEAGERSEAAEHAEGREGAESREDAEHDGEGREGREGAEAGGEREGEHSGEGRESGDGEHGEHGEHGGEEGEEPGVYIDRMETWDMTRRGARLVLSFNAQRNAFVGRVENTTDQRLCSVRVEVHLGAGPELGPTPRADVPAGGTIDVELATGGTSFETWTAHPELSACPGA